MNLTLKIAELFLEDEDSVRLSKFTSIEDAAAQALAQHMAGIIPVWNESHF